MLVELWLNCCAQCPSENCWSSALPCAQKQFPYSGC